MRYFGVLYGIFVRLLNQTAHGTQPWEGVPPTLAIVIDWYATSLDSTCLKSGVLRLPAFL